MQGFLETLEASSIAIFVRESPSIFAYTTVLSLHAMGLAIVVGVGGIIALRLLGFASGMTIDQTLKLYRLMYLGFTVNALSGLGLFFANATGLVENTAFLVKMGFIVVAVIIMEIIRARLVDAIKRDGTAVFRPRPALGYAALFAWIAALVAGRLTAYPNFVVAFFGV